MSITITDSDGTVRSTNWPPAVKPVMLDHVADQKRKAAQDIYDAEKAARGGLKSFTTLGYNFDGSIRRKNNTTGEIETIVPNASVPVDFNQVMPLGPSIGE